MPYSDDACIHLTTNIIGDKNAKHTRLLDLYAKYEIKITIYNMMWLQLCEHIY